MRQFRDEMGFWPWEFGKGSNNQRQQRQPSRRRMHEIEECPYGCGHTNRDDFSYCGQCDQPLTPLKDRMDGQGPMPLSTVEHQHPLQSRGTVQFVSERDNQFRRSERSPSPLRHQKKVNFGDDEFGGGPQRQNATADNGATAYEISTPRSTQENFAEWKMNGALCEEIDMKDPPTWFTKILVHPRCPAFNDENGFCINPDNLPTWLQKLKMTDAPLYPSIYSMVVLSITGATSRRMAAHQVLYRFPTRLSLLCNAVHIRATV